MTNVNTFAVIELLDVANLSSTCSTDLLIFYCHSVIFCRQRLLRYLLEVLTISGIIKYVSHL